MTPTLKTLSRLAGASAAFVLAACGPADKDDDKRNDLDDDSPLFLVHSALETADGRMNYFSLVESIDEAKTLDYANSLELPGRPRLYAAKGVGFFAIGNGESPVITRYEVKDGELVAGDSLSLQPFGVTSLGAQAVLFASDTKAYYKDAGQAQIIVWNPSTMEVDKTIPLPSDVIKAEWLTSLSQWAARDGEAYFAASWMSRQYDRVAPGTVLFRLDTATDELTRHDETRCRGLSKTARVGDTLYFFSDVINALGFSSYAADDGGQQDCILRISKDSTTFDADYVGSVSGALGDGKVGTVVTVTETGEAWVQVADLSVTPNGPGTTYNAWYSKGWSWWHLPLATLSGATQAPGEPGAYSSWTLTSGASFFVSQAGADYSLSTLVDLSSGSPKAGLSFPGFVLDVARIR